MVNIPQELSKKKWASRFFKSIALTGTALIFLLKPGISKGNEELKAEIQQVLKQYPVKEWRIQETNKDDSKTYTFEQWPNVMDWGNDALSFALNSVSTYYPDMKDHLNGMINSFRDEEHKDATITLLNKMVENISNPEQKVGAIIYALEMTVFNKWLFAGKYDSKITDETFKYIAIFDKEYTKRFKIYYAWLEASIQQMSKETEQKKKNLKEWLQEIESIMDKFTPNDVFKSESIKKLVLQTEDLFISSEYVFSNHTRNLFNATR